MAMTRGARRSLAEETLRILEDGVYGAPSGAERRIAAEQAAAEAATWLATPRAVAALEHAGRADDVAPWPATLSRETTLAACARLKAAAPDRAVIALNFASGKNPGGGFLGGSEAQEESLARSSGLYGALITEMAYYEANRRAPNALYTDHMIVSPDTPVFRGDDGALLETPYLVTFITAPAPNYGALRSETERGQAAPTLLRRMRAVLAIAAERKADALVLGAWGCGVFRNDPTMVAALWRDALSRPPAGPAPHVVMAIYDPRPGAPNLAAFQNALA